TSPPLPYPTLFRSSGKGDELATPQRRRRVLHRPGRIRREEARLHRADDRRDIATGPIAERRTGRAGIHHKLAIRVGRVSMGSILRSLTHKSPIRRTITASLIAVGLWLAAWTLSYSFLRPGS